MQVLSSVLQHVSYECRATKDLLYKALLDTGAIDSSLQLLRFCLLVLPAGATVAAAGAGSDTSRSARASDAEYGCLEQLLQFFLALFRSMRMLMSAPLLSSILQTFIQMLSSYASRSLFSRYQFTLNTKTIYCTVYAESILINQSDCSDVQ